MNLPLILIIAGIAVGLLLHWGLGVLLVVIGAVLLVLPSIRERSRN